MYIIRMSSWRNDYFYQRIGKVTQTCYYFLPLRERNIYVWIRGCSASPLTSHARIQYILAGVANRTSVLVHHHNEFIWF